MVSSDGTETAGIKLFTFLNSSVGVAGLGGVDRVLSFRIVHNLKGFLNKFYNTQATKYVAKLQALEDTLSPHFSIPSKSPPKFYKKALSQFSKLFPQMGGYITGIGQSQLLRRQISHELQFSCHLDSNTLSHALNNLNRALMLDLRGSFCRPTKQTCTIQGKPSPRRDLSSV